MIIENSRLQINAADHGAEITQIYDKTAGEQRLWNADARFWKRSSPVLFPNVGKLFGGCMRTEKGNYPLGQHGFARDMDFTCIEHSCDRLVYELKAGEETLKRYPYHFSFRISYVLQGNEITVNWKVKNEGEGEMPFTIGAHPAFVFSADHPKKEDHYVYIPGRESLTYHLLDPSCGCAKDQRYTIPIPRGYLPLTEALFANDALIFDDGQINEAWLCGPDHKPVIGVKAEGFPNFGIWSVKDAPFVCLEPWHGRCDDVDFEGMFAEKKNAVVLNGGEIFDLSYKIVVA